MIVKVTQYMRPDGRQVTRELEISDECSRKYKEILDCGCRLAAEQLTTLEASQVIECSFGLTYYQILTKGSDFEENKKALETLIMQFNRKEFEKLRAKRFGWQDEC